ncbi:MAG TPA: T9SS type A sorting domain-containing protein [Bacteroidales bacterium]|nr:T9SS type A sorting domain-containing protein [Bacteroidales bacterium]HPT01701.1 T9SS type A sorting domain-containing protein [Bacteroidales bacterium]
MKTVIHYISLLLLILPAFCSAQYVWKKNYTLPYGSWANEVTETYDKGYLTGGLIRNLQSPYFGYILKTDINGNKLWTKVIDGARETTFGSVNATSDGGFIAGGHYNTQGNDIDSYVIKFNACAEPQWCTILPDNIYHYPTIISRGIFETPDGGFFVHRMFEDFVPDGRIWSIAKLSASGNVEWLNYYVYNNPDWYPGSQLQLRTTLTTDTCLVVCGMVNDTIFHPDPGAQSDMPFWFKVDINGNLLWDRKWNLYWGGTPAEVYAVTEGRNNSYYSGGIMDPGLGHPYVFKIDKDGDSISYFNVYNHPGSIACKPHYIRSFNDTTLLLNTQFGVTYTDNWWSLQLIDTLGNNYKCIYKQEHNIPMMSIKTFDNKIVVLGIDMSGNGAFPYDWISLSKFNTNLEYDSIYTAPRTYDSLCPHPIVSDTIPVPPNCLVFTALPEVKGTSDILQLKVYPNPASSYTTVEMPEFSLTTTKSKSVNQQQYRPLKGEVELSLINISGKIVNTDVFDASERNHVVNVSKLPEGMYVLHLTQKGKFVAQGKVMVLR